MKQFISECEPDKHGTLVLGAEAYTYLITVRRMRTGDSLPVLLPKSGKVHMHIESVDTAKKEIRLITQLPAGTQPLSSADQIAEPRARIILLQWILKGTKTDTVIRQATETGVRHILPVAGEFSVAKKQNPVQMERFKRIIREARQQSGSLIDTGIAEPAPLTSVLKALLPMLPAQGTVLGMCCETAGKSIGFHEFLASKPTHIVLAIGAEGGISPTETALLYDTGFQSLHFKTNVLRAETAALYAVAAAQTIIHEAEQWQLRE